MALRDLFRRKPAAPPQRVTTGRLEIEQDGEVAYLEYSLSGNVLGLIHTEVPDKLRGRGLASELAKTAFDWAREKSLKVDVVCPSVQGYISRHHEYDDLILR
jgi:predicted GNAT family acetyltransferase